MGRNLDLVLTSIMRSLYPRAENDAYLLIGLSPFIFIFTVFIIKRQFKILKKDKELIDYLVLITLCIMLVYFGPLTILFLIGVFDL
jgi:hypothetical protein